MILLVYFTNFPAVLTADLIFPQTDVWIGLTDRGQGILFYWADGTPLDYTNWMAFNPSLNDAVSIRAGLTA